MKTMAHSKSRTLRKLISQHLPQSIAHRILRSYIHLPQTLDPQLIVKVAETKDELEQAFTLLYLNYLKENYTLPNEARLRVTKYHALPSTSVLIAKRGEKVVGTVSVIRSSLFGFPMQKIFNIPSNLPPDSRLAEISSLAVSQDDTGPRGEVLFSLFKYLYNYCTEYFDVSHLLITVNPSWIEFYRGVLLFDKISFKRVENYDFVNGAPAEGAILELKKVASHYPLIYHNKLPEQDLYHFLVHKKFDNFLFPLRKKSLISDPFITPELLEYFFVQRLPILSTMNDDELYALRQIYKDEGYLQLIPEPKVQKIWHSRRQGQRFETNIEAYAFDSKQTLHRLKVTCVSQSGLKVVSLSPLEPDSSYAIFFNTEEFQKVQVKGVCAWSSPSNEHGVKIEMQTPSWNNFLEKLVAYYKVEKKTTRKSA